MSEARDPWRRRALLLGGGALAVVWTMGVPWLLARFGSNLTFRDMPGLAPFRMLEASGSVSTSGTGTLLAGLDGAKKASVSQQELMAEVTADPCAALFGTSPDPRLPVAFFSDFNCPNCRVLDAELLDYDRKNPGTIRIIRHELPLLGAASTVASEAVLAAELQGGYDVMHARLMRAPMVTDLNYVVRLAESVGLDGQKLVADMQSPGIATTLERSRAIATLFGFYGTPSTVIGRTAFIGAIPAADVKQIIDMELASPGLGCLAR